MEPLEEALLAEAVASHRLAFLLDLRAALQAGRIQPAYLDWDWDPSKTLWQNPGEAQGYSLSPGGRTGDS